MSKSLTLIMPRDARIRLPVEPVRVVGMDLGTTNSEIAEIVAVPGSMELPEVRCLEVEQETLQGPFIHAVVPSVLALHEGRLLVGEGAKGLRARPAEYGLEQNRNLFWECKNDIGVRRTYHKAPAGFRSASEVGGHLLKFLMDAAMSESDTPVAATVVTIPAAFQAAQRRDTFEASRLAGIELAEGALLDEPIAAFVAYLVAHGKEVFTASSPQRLLVFDFGGGTCDVALFRLLPPDAPGAPVGAAPLAVSRYHRLGGGDIDRAIVLEVLLPQLIKQNDLDPHRLDYDDKARSVIPSLLGAAEALKTNLCREITRLQQLGRYQERRSVLVQRTPNVYPCSLRDGTTLKLQSPTLSADQFERVLQPFLDRDMLHPRDTEYQSLCSIFAPLRDVLERARMEPGEVDDCLLVGGSSLIPQVVAAVEHFFPNAQVLHFDDRESTQTAVAQGAAWHAMALALCGRGMVGPVSSDSIDIETRDGRVPLIKEGAELPFPANGAWAENTGLKVPVTGLTEAVTLRVELRGGNGKLLMRRLWTIRPIVEKGDGLRLRYRMDANQVLHLDLALADDPERGGFEASIENPLTSVVNPNARRDEILELEERLRTESLTEVQKRRTVDRVARLEAELGNREKALHLLAAVNRDAPAAERLNRMAMICGEMADHEREEKLYREAARLSPGWDGPLFNLALAQERRGKFTEAMHTLEETTDPRPPYLVLKARLSQKLKQPVTTRDALLDQAFARFGPPSTLDKWMLAWYLHGAELQGDEGRTKEAEEAWEALIAAGEDPKKPEEALGGELPEGAAGGRPVET